MHTTHTLPCGCDQRGPGMCYHALRLWDRFSLAFLLGTRNNNDALKNLAYAYEREYWAHLHTTRAELYADAYWDNATRAYIWPKE
jgi:hypothetical protein